MTIRFSAPAKINICLHVLKRRVDGLHQIDSLVIFLDCGEWVTVSKANRTELNIIGPQAAKLPVSENNLILRATRLFPARCTSKITLHKSMPVAAGIGGGSADAAATLKAMSKIWQLPVPTVSNQLQLGADVPVCMHSKPVLMQGVGEVISSVLNFPKLFCCLVNPGVVVKTEDIFKKLIKKDNSAISILPKSEKDWFLTRLIYACARDRVALASRSAPKNRSVHKSQKKNMFFRRTSGRAAAAKRSSKLTTPLTTPAK